MDEETPTTATEQDVTPTTPAEPQETPKLPEEETPQAENTPSEAEPENVLNNYSLEEENAEDPSEQPAKEAEAEQEVPAFAFPDGYEFGGNPIVQDVMASIATEMKMDGRQAGEYASKVWDAIQAKEQEAFRQDDLNLKSEWGSNYNVKIKETKAFLGRIAGRAGLSNQDLAALQSPKGFRLIHALMSQTGENSVAIGNTSEAEKSWADSVMRDPSHPDYKDFHDTRSPRYSELSMRYYKAQGLR